MKLAALLALIPFACLNERPEPEPPAPCICFDPVRCPSDAGLARCYRVVGCQSPMCPRP